MTSLIGNCTSPTTAHSLTYPSSHSVKDLESQVTSLESEVDRVSQSLNTQRTAVTTAETNTRKVVEEHAREASSQVSPPSFGDSEADVIFIRHER